LATPALIEKVLENLREDTAGEVVGFSKDRLIWEVVRKGISFIGLVEGVPICAYGIKEDSFVAAEVWLASTPLIERYALRFLRENRRFMDWAVRKYGVLGGVVQVGNVRSQKWLRWLGFELGEQIAHELLGPVYPFERRLF
jgi:hypothetical protein